MSAPSETCCRLDPGDVHLTRETTASTSGIVKGDNHRAGAQAKTEETDPHHDGDRLPQRLHGVADRVGNDLGLIGDQLRFDALSARSAVNSRIVCSMFLPSVGTSPPSRIERASPMAVLPFTRNRGCGGSA